MKCKKAIASFSIILIFVLATGCSLTGSSQTEGQVDVLQSSPIFGHESYDFIWDFHDDIAFFEKDGKIGLINAQYEVLMNAEFDKVLPFVGNLCRVMKNGLYGLIDKQGNIASECQWLQISDKPMNGLWQISNGKRVSFLDEKGKQMIDLRYSEIGSFEDGIAIVGTKDQKGRIKYGVINDNWEELIAPVWNEIGSFSGGLARAVRHESVPSPEKGEGHYRSLSTYSFFDRNGNIILAYNDDEGRHVGEYHEGLAFFTYNGVAGYLDTSGNVAIDLGDKYKEGHYSSDFSEGIAWLHHKEDGLVAINKQGEYLFKGEKLFMLGATDTKLYSFQNGLALYTNSKGAGYINTQGEIIGTFYDVSKPEDGLIYVTVNGTYRDRENNFMKEGPFYGYVTTEGKTLVGIGPYTSGRFSENGLAKIQDVRTGLYGYMNRQGEIVIDFQWEIAEDFCGDIAVVSKDKYGYEGAINAKGELVVPFVWQDIYCSAFVPDLLTTQGKIPGKPEYGYYYETYVETSWPHSIGLLNEKGELVLQPLYRSFFSDNEIAGPKKHLYVKGQDEKEGLYTREGQMLIPPVWESMRYWTDDILKARDGYGVDYYLTPDGKVLCGGKENPMLIADNESAVDQTQVEILQARLDAFYMDCEEYGYLVTFGYYQDEPIQWRVLTIEGDAALVISEHILDAQQFHPYSATAPWGTNALCAWLNHEFYDAAFSKSERARIVEGKGIGGSVFLLSVEEVKRYMPGEINRRGIPTTYTQNAGRYYMEDGAGHWWLRTNGYYAYSVAVVQPDGHISTAGAPMYASFGVRPVIWLKIE